MNAQTNEQAFEAQGEVKAIDQDSQQLANALIDGTKIVVMK